MSNVNSTRAKWTINGVTVCSSTNPAENNLVAAPIELKSGGKAYEPDVVEKLENSLEFAANIAPGLKTLKTVYAPILFRGGDIKWAKVAKS